MRTIAILPLDGRGALHPEQALNRRRALPAHLAGLCGFLHDRFHPGFGVHRFKRPARASRRGCQSAADPESGLLMAELSFRPLPPLTTATFLFNYAVLGNGQHGCGVSRREYSVPSGQCVLLFLAASRFFGRAWPAFFAAALWAVHPIATEAVKNLVGRSDQLAAMAILGGLLLYQRSAPLRGLRMALAAAGLFAIGVLGGFARELAAALIAVM